MGPVGGTFIAASSTSPLQRQWATPSFTVTSISFHSPGNLRYAFEKLTGARSDAAKALVFTVLLKATSLEGLLAATGSPVGREIVRQQGELGVRDFIYTKVPHNPDGTSYELHTVDASELRARMFALTVSSDKDQTAFAMDYLTHIDTIRQEDGAAEDEPRHPDIQSGRPWPHVAPPD